MAEKLKQAFNTLNISITQKHISAVLDMVAAWETRKDAPLVLHSMLVGVYKIYFVQQDRDNLFQVFDVTSKELSDLIKTVPEISPKFKVMSDPFNLFCIWLVHLAKHQIKNVKMRDAFCIALMKYLQYKFFTGRCRVFFPYTVDEGVMTATVMDLSKKFKLVKFGSWYEVFLSRAEMLISNNSIHKETFVLGSPDQKMGYIVVDTYNRINSALKIICDEFKKHHRSGDTVRSTSGTITDAEGEKILIERSSTIQMIDSKLSRDILNVNAWVNPSYIAKIGSQFPSINNNLIKVALTTMSSLAEVQYKTPRFDPHQMVNGEKLVVGMVHLVKLIITTSAAITTSEGVALSNTVQAWKTLHNTFTSSRTLNTDVLLIKASMAKFVDDLGATPRPATKISLRMALIMYIVYRFIILAK